MKDILVVLLLLFCVVGTSQVSNQDIAKQIDSLILSRYNKGLFNGSLLVQKEGEVIYKRSLGWANMDRGDTLSLEAPMRIASITKTFTAVCILKLAQDGKIDIFEDINTYLPEIEKRGMTIHHLLSHSSGIAYINGKKHYGEVAKLQKKRGDHRMTNEDVLFYFKENKPKPEDGVGEKYSYSNISFSILASLIEKITKVKYKDYLIDNIFEPLDMSSTFLYLPSTTKSNLEKVISYRLKKTKLKESPVYYKYNQKGELKFSDDIYGDKYICSTVGDMNKFNSALLNKKILNNDYFNKMITPVYLNNGKPSSDKYAYGIYQTSWSDSLSYQHSGSIASFSTLNLFDLKGNQLVLFLNIRHGDFFYLYQEILKIMEGNFEGKWISRTKKKNNKIQEVFEEKYKINYAPLYD